MNLKEAFRYQNKLQALLDEAQGILDCDSNVTNVANTYLRHKVMAEAEDETILDLPQTEYAQQITDIARFMLYLLEEYRGQGIGTELLRAMMDALEREGVRQVSLSVQKGNPAVRLYRRVGFRIIRETEEEYIMVDRLGRASSGKEHAHAGQAGGRGGPIQPDRGQAGRAGDL